ncbi:hypothetical protein BH10PSE17_BH10PSE17_10340 [soil metagenome]
MNRHSNCFASLALMMGLAACGGGSSSDADVPSPAPVPAPAPAPAPAPGPAPTPAPSTPQRISAATGGTVSSPDGSVKLTFGPGAFTADVDVTLAPAPAPALPASSDFAHVAPVPNRQTTFAFAGGTLKAGAPVRMVVNAQAAVRAALLRPKADGDEEPPVNGVLHCAGDAWHVGWSIDDSGGPNDGFLSSCPTGTGSLTAGPVRYQPLAPAAPVFTQIDADARWVEAIEPGGRFVHGAGERMGSSKRKGSESTFQFFDAAGLRQEIASPSGPLGIETSTAAKAVIALNQSGLVLQRNDDCTVSQSRIVATSGAGASLQSVWTSAPLLQSGETCTASAQAPRNMAATWVGTGWLVAAAHDKPTLYWISPAGVVQRKVETIHWSWIGDQSPPTLFPIALAGDAAGNAWLALDKATPPPRCVAGLGFNYPGQVCLSVLRVPAGATSAAEVARIPLNVAAQPDLVMGPAGSVYVGVARATDRSSGSAPTLYRFNQDGSTWSVALPAAGFEGTASVARGVNGKVYLAATRTSDASAYGAGLIVARIDEATQTVETARLVDTPAGITEARLFHVDPSERLTAFGNVGVIESFLVKFAF